MNDARVRLRDRGNGAKVDERARSGGRRDRRRADEGAGELRLLLGMRVDGEGGGRRSRRRSGEERRGEDGSLLKEVAVVVRFSLGVDVAQLVILVEV